MTRLSAFTMASVALFVGLFLGYLARRPAPTRTDPHPTTAHPAPPAVTRTTAAASSGGATLRDVERFFHTWGGYAVWADGFTEFAMWRPSTRSFSAFYGVVWQGGHFYSRRLPRLTRPLIDHGQKAKCPGWFTETATMREAFYREHPDIQPSTATPSDSDLPELPPKPPVTAEQDTPSANSPSDAPPPNSSADPQVYPVAPSDGPSPAHFIREVTSVLEQQLSTLDRIADHAATEPQARKARNVAAYGEESLRRCRVEQLIDEDAAADLELLILRLRAKLATKL